MTAHTRAIEGDEHVDRGRRGVLSGEIGYKGSEEKGRDLVCVPSFRYRVREITVWRESG